MELTQTKQLKALLEKYGIQPTKLRGQHFLISQKALRTIVDAAELRGEDVVLEIGPGLGTLTRELAGHAGFVIAVEKDLQLVKILEATMGQLKNVRIIHGDILPLLLSDLYRNLEQTEQHKLKLVANIPYSITSEILIKFLSQKPRLDRMVVMVQKEVAERIVERDNKSSRLSLFVHYFGTPLYLETVPRGAFYPSPKVDSAIIKIQTHNGMYASDPIKEQEFFKLIQLGFSHPRRKLISNLNTKIVRAKLVPILKELGIDENIRAENLHFLEWIKLFEATSASIGRKP